MKFLLIFALVAFLLYLFVRRFFVKKEVQSVTRHHGNRNFILIDTTSTILSNATRNTLWTVGIGFILFLALLILGLKIKVLWIALPLSFYLIGQLFVYTNHVRFTKDQRIYFDPTNNQVFVDLIKADSIAFNLATDIIQVKEVKAIQKNRGILFGYYKIKLRQGQLIVPYLVEQNSAATNRQFFSYLNKNFKITVESRLFPII
ncbi:hypothetical protein ORI89_12490 [Sphingobacterium sp. UT-1RO-CII-1]|uniref:hypothetical protein n=1 Tax=Sphingobacterium sp. UT-1RO-CII-1 TaxID=2995225 RepID=UPI00227C48B4|nr:hypothetical protein [Sphingobacterium sp. UT-1RO-CII-1]MCY4780475.1 hypothetical protein [Sphingobacterium sp. UT-1RO-CII-1]